MICHGCGEPLTTVTLSATARVDEFHEVDHERRVVERYDWEFSEQRDVAARCTLCGAAIPLDADFFTYNDQNGVPIVDFALVTEITTTPAQALEQIADKLRDWNDADAPILMASPILADIEDIVNALGLATDAPQPEEETNDHD